MSQRTSLFRLLFSRTSWLSLLIIVCAASCIVFGFFGWWSLRAEMQLSVGDVIYRAITGVSLAVPFDKAADWQGDWRLEIARWSGVLMIVAAASKTLSYLLGDHWRRKRAESQSNHWLIVGNSLFARRLSDAAIQQGLTTNRLSCGETDDSRQEKNLFLDSSQWSLKNADALGLQRAKGIVVATSEDSTNRNIAREIRSNLPADSDQIIMASVESTWLSMRIDEVDGQSGIRIFSEAQIAVQRLQRKHPPFLLAHKLRHSRIHLVIVNFSTFGEAVLIETLLSSLTTDLQKPLFTIVDPNTNAIKNALQLRYPELHRSAHLNFIEGQLDGENGIPDPDTLQKLLLTAPVTAIYCCALDDSKAMKSALISQALAFRTVDCGAAIFCRQESSHLNQDLSAGTEEVTPGQIISFGTVDELVEDAGLFDDSVDEFAKAFHLAYQEKASSEKPANVSWQDLPEDKRDANRRIVVHIPAKLHSMGINVENWLSSASDRPDIFTLTGTDHLVKTEKHIEALAQLEHERWMADRRINGWTYGKKRDDIRRIHPDLRHYDSLDEASKVYDREIVNSLFKLFAQ